MAGFYSVRRSVRSVERRYLRTGLCTISAVGGRRKYGVDEVNKYKYNNIKMALVILVLVLIIVAESILIMIFLQIFREVLSAVSINTNPEMYNMF